MQFDTESLIQDLNNALKSHKSGRAGEFFFTLPVIIFTSIDVLIMCAHLTNKRRVVKISRKGHTF